MKRTLLLAALAATAATSAFAQSSVTVYGRLNMTIENEKVGDNDATNLNNNASRIGFRGVEDLGGGLAAIFEIEHGFNPDTGTASNARFWSRSSFVGLRSNAFGQVRLGNMTSEAYYATADYVSMHNHDTGTSEDKLYDNFSQSTDKISYKTPSFAGNTIEVAGTTRDAGVGARTYDVAYNGDFGPLHVGAGYTTVKDGPSEISARALYELGAFTFGGYYQYTMGEFTGEASDAQERNNFRVSGMYALGASEFHANFGWADDRGNTSDSGAMQWTLGYNYNLSKRTKLYGYYTEVKNDSNASYFTGVADADYRSFALGIRHNF
jgi:predicted porin